MPLFQTGLSGRAAVWRMFAPELDADPGNFFTRDPGTSSGDQPSTLEGSGRSRSRL